MQLAEHFLKDINFQFRKLKNQADNAINQIGTQEFFKFIGSSDNSIAILVKHISGNMKSRWTDVLTTDGEKQSRNRPDEFVQDDRELSNYMAEWDESWDILFATISNLHSSDLLKEISIRGEKHSVVEAIHRQLTHYAGHIGQIVLLAKHFSNSSWNTLSIPKDTKQFSDGNYKSQN